MRHFLLSIFGAVAMRIRKHPTSVCGDGWLCHAVSHVGEQLNNCHLPECWEFLSCTFLHSSKAKGLQIEKKIVTEINTHTANGMAVKTVTLLLVCISVWQCLVLPVGQQCFTVLIRHQLLNFRCNCRINLTHGSACSCHWLGRVSCWGHYTLELKVAHLVPFPLLEMQLLA